MIVQNMPVLTSPFVGRTAELAEVSRLLAAADCTLLSLVGTGGVGKSRLALEAAALSRDFFPDGIYFVPLQSLSSTSSLILAIGEAINFQFFAGGEPHEQLVQYLKDKTLLLILDNFEHLLDEAALVSDLLAAVPAMKVLATSRERLNLLEEWVFEVGGLTYPQGINGSSIEEYGAVQLFVQSARRVQPAFSLADEREAVIHICSLVQGMPLALELASAWTRVLRCDEIAAEIERGLDILETSTRNVPSRHRSMRAVLDQSWDRLTDAEKHVFQKLSVFRGGFTREAATAIAGASLHTLSTLVDKSWLYRSPSTGRYDVHELLRQFGEERLWEASEHETIYLNYTRYFAALVERCETGIKFRRQTESLNEMERDFENIRGAWKWATDQLERDLINQMVEGLNFFCDMRARFHEGEELFRCAAEAFATEDSAIFYRLRTRHTRVILLGMMAEDLKISRFRAEMEEAVKAAREREDAVELAFGLYMIGMVTTGDSDMKDAIPYFQESLDIAIELNDRFYAAEFLSWIGVSQDDQRKAKAYHWQSAEIQREIGDLNGLGWNLLHLARLAFWERHYTEATTYALEAEQIQRERGDSKGLYWNMLSGSERAFQSGDFERAKLMAAEVERISQRLNLLPITQATLGWVGLLKIVTEEDYEAGRRLCKQALLMKAPQKWAMGDARLHASIGLVIAAYREGEYEAARDYYGSLAQSLETFGIYDTLDTFSVLAPLGVLLLAAQGDDGQAVELFATVFRVLQNPETAVLGWLRKIPLMTHLLATLESQLGADAFAVAWEHGSSLSTDTAVNMLRRLAANEPEDISKSDQAATPNPDALTEREREVLKLVGDGLSNREIARELYLALGTVKWYLSEISSKLGASNRTQAVARARELGLIA